LIVAVAVVILVVAFVAIEMLLFAAVVGGEQHEQVRLVADYFEVVVLIND
jgi:hypothetical protein